MGWPSELEDYEFPAADARLLLEIANRRIGGHK